MKIGRAAQEVKSAREEIGSTQLEITFDDYFGSRESISQQENGRYQVQPELTKYYAEKHNNPFPAIQAAHEYTSWGIAKLNGEAVDLHRTSVSLKTKEELKEALEAVSEANKKITVNPQSIDQRDIKAIETAIQECIDAITALTHYVAVLCKEYGISWMKMWTQHKLKLIQRRFVKQ
ncbi:XRE family transcriptional regulator [Metabacillus bambusae]|uniref:XRE family transcriptional regulator n=1 Tax=Metabacillus bambusae TaxID=2795218 RepID=A0ABS3N7N5_9BACI|nr:XRE family transcriptional regulator [Metabacillus bambusae]MBO1514306.1 XRE family transcriptional regulator [Metabacillus bambusae]